MRMQKWKKVSLMILSGSVLLQVPTCFEAVTALSSAVTAGGVMYLVARVLE